jgi:nucleoid-associated protein YgaU
MAKNLILIISLLLLVSCASRKVAIVKEDVKITVDRAVVVKVDGTYVKENNVVTEDCEEEIEYKPLDTLKPMVIDGKQYVNTIIKLKKKKGVRVDKTKVTSKVSSVKKLNVKREDSKKLINKKIDKKANYWMYLWFLIPVAIIIVLEKYGRSLFTLSR